MAKSQDKAINLPRLNLQRVEIRLIGDSPLICHAWSEKAIGMMIGKQTGAANAGKERKVPERDFMDSLYWLSERPAEASFDVPSDARFSFPAVAFKSAAVDAWRFVDGIKPTVVRGAFHIIGEQIEIAGRPEPREDMVRVGMGTADIRYRGEFKEWSVTLPIRFNANALTLEQIVNLFNIGGFGVGVGEWRPERNGSHGMFHVATSAED